MKDQVTLLRKEGLKIDLVYADLNIAYLYNGWYRKKRIVERDSLGNKSYIITGPTWPKNNRWGLQLWINSFVNWIVYYLEKEGRPDIIHTHTYLGAMVALKIKEKFNTPYIVTEHYTGWMDGSIRALHRKLGLTALKNADVVTSVSGALKDFLQPSLEKEVVVLPNFIDVDLFTFEVNQDIIGSTAKKINIVSVGDLIPRKQIGVSLQIIKQLSTLYDIQYTIIGDGREKENLKNEVTRLEIESIVSFAGRLHKSSVAKMLINSDILLHSSQLETFGLVVAEALCSGVMVVSSPNMGVQMMKDLPGIFISSGDSKKELKLELEKALKVRKRNDWQEFRKKISMLSKEQLNTTNYAHKFTKLINSC